jgi:hypothetical protein
MSFAGLRPPCWGYLSPVEHSILRFALNKGEHFLGRDIEKDGGSAFCDTFCSECLAAGLKSSCNKQHGTSAQGLQDVITDRSISARHCRIFLEGVRDSRSAAPPVLGQPCYGTLAH